ncbi:Transposase domain [Azotobacter beijerinckii]|uniref:Transposase domain n=1 Tax=Azotobacter beijerinckii TaxID=170623 RepID=A0A1I4EF57_9GAMM|nr:Transposase domain [Azotobacter beijerinckii]
MKQRSFANAESLASASRAAGDASRSRWMVDTDRADRVSLLQGLRLAPAYPLAPMLRVHLIQSWLGYSDQAMEEVLYEVTILRTS